MEFSFVSVAIIIALIATIVWLYYFIKNNQDNAPTEKIHLAEQTKIPNTSSDSVFFMDFWLYINSWSPGKKQIIAQGPAQTAESNTTSFDIYLNSDTPTLMCDVQYSDAKNAEGQKVQSSKHTLTNSFPLQSWTHVTIAFDGNIVDYYMNGKLVSSSKLPVIISPSPTADIILGKPGGSDIYMTKFVKTNSRASTSSVYDSYTSDNGDLTKTQMADYKVNLTLLKNNQIARKFNVL